MLAIALTVVSCPAMPTSEAIAANVRGVPTRERPEEIELAHE
jgi:hypothetical protein